LKMQRAYPRATYAISNMVKHVTVYLSPYAGRRMYKDTMKSFSP
jgi:hypothetical protein